MIINNNLDYIEAYILQLKAYCIATNFIYDEEQIIEAIKCYAEVALKYKDLINSKKELINIQ